jgi:hypothetical protein
MARHWHEPYDPNRHRNRMLGAGPPADESPDPIILPRSVFFVEAAGFTFEFHSLDQLRAALEYFAQKVRPSSRIPHFPSGSVDHWEGQRWYDRIPMKLLKESRRLRVVKALTEALAHFSGGSGGVSEQ